MTASAPDQGNAFQSLSSYTYGVPVVTPELLEQLQRDGLLCERLIGTQISESPAVLGQTDAHLRIWRQGFQPEVRQFIDTAIDVYGIAAGAELHAFFRNYRITLDASVLMKENLYDEKGKQVISGEDIQRIYRDLEPRNFQAPIDIQLTRAFGDYVVNSLALALSSFSTPHYLLLDNDSKVDYDTQQALFYDPHGDPFNNLLLHMTDPATVYLRRRLNSTDPYVPLFRTAAGDMSFHRMSLLHGRATRPRIMNGKANWRMCLGFQVHPVKVLN